MIKNCRLYVMLMAADRLFVRLYCGQGSSLLWTPTLRPCWSSTLAQGEEGNWWVCAVCVWRVWCVCATCRVMEGLSRSEQLVGYFYSAPPLCVACCLAKPRLALIQRQPEDFATSICFGSHVSAADTLTLLIKASAAVTVYRGHCRTLFSFQGLIPCSLYA